MAARARVRARPPSSRFRAAKGSLARPACSLRPIGAASGLALLAARPAPTGSHAGPPPSRCRSSRSSGRRRTSRPRCGPCSRPPRAEPARRLDLAELEAAVEARADRCLSLVRPRVPAHAEGHVVPERPVAVLRHGTDSWLAAASGRVIAPLDKGARAGLPRIWLTPKVDLRLGEPRRRRRARRRPGGGAARPQAASRTRHRRALLAARS